VPWLMGRTVDRWLPPNMNPLRRPSRVVLGNPLRSLRPIRQIGHMLHLKGRVEAKLRLVIPFCVHINIIGLLPDFFL